MQSDITLSELRKSINKLKKKKSLGPDNIANEMLSHLDNSSLKILLNIFNLIWSQGRVPQIWKEAIMMPILKKGKNRSNISSCRPISLTSSCCKLMDRIFNKRMQTYLESESITSIGHEQAGFGQYRASCEAVKYTNYKSDIIIYEVIRHNGNIHNIYYVTCITIKRITLQ